MATTEYLPRLLDARLREALGAAPVVLIDGPRGAGKTTTASRLAASTLMLPRDLEVLRFDAEAYLRTATPPVLLDEWQLAGTELLWAVKRLVDDDPTPGRFILTGSVEPATYGPTYPLTGRAVRLVLRPMTHAELEGRGHETTFLNGVFDRGGPRRSAAFDIQELLRPGFPAARHMPDPRLFLDAYATLVSQRAGDEGRDAGRLVRTLRVLAVLTGQAVPDQRVWEAADINKATWKHYDDLLNRVHMTADTRAFESNRLKRLTGYPKRFLADTAMACALSEIGSDELRSDPTAAGRYLESFVMQQLRPQVDGIGGVLRHMRTGAGGREIDAVVETGRSLVAMEVKLEARPGAADARHLVWLRDELPERFHRGFVVHTGSETYPIEERIEAIPVSALMG